MSETEHGIEPIQPVTPFLKEGYPKGIPAEENQYIREGLKGLPLFKDPAGLRNFMKGSESLRLWANGAPERDKPNQQVDQTIYYLFDKGRVDQKDGHTERSNGLILLLRELKAKYSDDEELKENEAVMKLFARVPEE